MFHRVTAHFPVWNMNAHDRKYECSGQIRQNILPQAGVCLPSCHTCLYNGGWWRTVSRYTMFLVLSCKTFHRGLRGVSRERVAVIMAQWVLGYNRGARYLFWKLLVIPTLQIETGRLFQALKVLAAKECLKADVLEPITPKLLRRLARIRPSVGASRMELFVTETYSCATLSNEASRRSLQRYFNSYSL